MNQNTMWRHRKTGKVVEAELTEVILNKHREDEKRVKAYRILTKSGIQFMQERMFKDNFEPYIQIQ